MAIHARSSNAVGWVIGALFLVFATISDASDKGTVGADGIQVNSIAIVSGSGQSGPVGSAGQPVVVEVRTPLGVVVSGATIQWSTDTGVALAVTSTVTDAAGRTSVSFTYSSVGSGSVIATDNASGFSARAAVSGFGGDTLSIVSGDRQSGAVGTGSAQPMVVEVRDAGGNPISSRSIGWTDITSSSSALNASSSMTDINGRASMGFTYLDTLPPSFTFRATDALTGANVDFTMSAAGMPTLVLVSGGSQVGARGSHSAQPLVVELRDAAGGPIAGNTINWVDTSGSNYFVFDAANSVTDASGRASMGFTFTAIAPCCSPYLQATDSGTSLTVTAAATTLGGDTLARISGDNQVGPVGSHSSAPLVAEIRDATGNPVSGRTVLWTDPAGIAFTFDAPSSVTDGSGRASMGFTYLAGSGGGALLKAQDAVSGLSVSWSAVGLGSDTLTVVSTPFQFGTAGSAAQPIVVQLLDASGNAIVGRLVNWTVTGDAVLSANSSLSDATGRASISSTFGPTLTNSQINARDSVTGTSKVAGSLYLAGYACYMTQVSGGSQNGVPGAAAQPLVVELRDAAGNPIVGSTAGWSVTSGDVILSAASSLTDSNGRASVGASFGTVNSVVRAVACSGYAWDFALASVGWSQLIAISQSSLSGSAGTPSAVPIVVEMRGAGGQPLVGRNINWSVQPGGTAVLGAASSLTDASGQASMSFTYGTNNSDVLAFDPVTSQSVNTSVTIVAIDSIRLVSGSGQSGAISSAASAPIVVEIRDGSGIPVAGRSINWTCNGCSVSAPSTLTDGAGQASVSFSYGSSVSNISVTATDSISGQYSIAYGTATGQDSLTLVSGNGQTGAVNSAAGVPVVVEVRDAGGNPVVGRAIGWNSPEGTVSVSSSLTDGAGQASVNFTFGSSAGATRVFANDTVNGQYVVTWGTATGNDSLTVISGNGQSGATNSVSAQPLVVEVRDASGNPIAGRTIGWIVSGGSILAFAGPTSVTDASGQASMTFTYGDSYSSPAQIRANDPISGNSVFFTVTNTGDEDFIMISGNGQVGAISSAGAQPMVVEIRSANGSPVVGRTVQWAGGPGIVRAAATSITDAGGRASMSFSYGSTATTTTITAVDAVTRYFTQFYLTSVGAESFTLVSGNGQTGIINTAGAQPLVVEVRDASGAPVVGRTIGWSNFGTGYAAPTSASSVTDAAGRASMGFTHGNIVSSSQIYATNSAPGGITINFNVTSLGADTLVLVSGNGQSGAVGTAGTPIVVEARDPSGNALAGRVINWSKSGPAALASSSSSTGASGRASVGFTFGPSQGQATITASDSVTAQTITISTSALGANEQFSAAAGNGQTGVVGAASTPLTIRLVDSGGAPIVGRGIQWTQIDASDLTFTSPTSTTTDSAGQASVSFTFGTAGTDIVRATETLNSQSIEMSVAALATTPTLTLVSGDGQSATVNTAFAQALVVNAQNSGGPAIGVTINWCVCSGSASASSGSTLTDVNGNASITLAAGGVVGAVTVTATRQDAPTLMATFSETVTAAPVPTPTLTVVSGDGQSAMVNTAFALPLAVNVQDSGVATSGVTVNWAVTAGSATPASGTSITDASGNASFGLIAGAAPGSVTITATRQDAPTVFGTFNETVTAAPVPTPTLTLVSGDGQSATVNTGFALPLAVNVQDSGVATSGVTVNWAVTAGSATPASGTSITDANGNAFFDLIAGAAPGPVTITATRQDAPTVFTTFNATVIAAAIPTLTVVSGDGQTGLTGSTADLPLVVELLTGQGGPFADQAIIWTVAAGAAGVSASSVATDVNGRAQVSLVYGTSAGPATVTASYGTQSVSFTATAVNATSVAPAGGDGQSGPPGSTLPQALKVRLAAPVAAAAFTGRVTAKSLAGVPVTFAVTAGGGSVSVTSAVTDALGEAETRLTLGPLPGTNTVSATFAGGATTTFTAITLPALGSVIIVSGDNQTMATNTASAPLVVELRNATGGPLVGVTVDWTGTNATPAASSSLTDANGRASITATVDQPGMASVRASSALLATSVSFALNGGVAELPALTPQQEAIARAIDSLCPALAALPSRSPGQQDLLARCQEIVDAAGISADDTIAALEQLFSESSLAQSNAAITAASSQYQNVTGRLAALRSGQPVSGLGGLSFSGPGGVISLQSLMTAFADESPAVAPAAAGFDRWGFFASGTIGRGESDATRSAPAYDYDVNGLTVGVDYRHRDDWIMGAALGYSRQDTDLTADGGKVAMTGVSLSAYSTYSFKDRFYLDGVVTWGHNRFEMNRHIVYTLPLPGGGISSVDQTATGKPGGDLFEAAVTFGGDFHKDAWSLGPYGRLIYTQMGFDGYQESMKTGAGNGLALVVDSREVIALTGVVGAKLGYTHSAEWGVVVPTVSLEWEHEFKDDLQSLSARFLYDPTATPIVADGDPLDGNYLRFGVGMSIVLRRGRSGFFLFDRAVGRDGISQDNFSLGIRIEF